MNVNQVKPEIKERILNAVMALEAQGIEGPTNKQVRAQMGNKGSYADISPVMREYKEGKRAQEEQKFEMPAPLRASIENNISQVWLVASRLAGEAVEVVAAESQKKEEKSRVDLMQADETIQELEERISQLLTKNSELENGMASLRTECDSALNNYHAADRQAAILASGIEDKERQLGDAKEEIAAQRSEVGGLQKVAAKVDAISDELVRVKADLAAANNSVVHHKEIAAGLSQEVKLSQKNAAELHSKVALADSGAAELKALLAVARDQANTRKDELLEARQENKLLQAKIDKIQKDIVENLTAFKPD